MLALWIILAILALLGLLCCLSAVLYVDIGETTRIQAGIAGLRYTLVDTREESPRQKVKALKREQERKEKQARKEAKQKRKAARQRTKTKKKKPKGQPAGPGKGFPRRLPPGETPAPPRPSLKRKPSRARAPRIPRKTGSPPR